MYRLSKVPGILLALTVAVALAACQPKITRTDRGVPAKPTQQAQGQDPAQPVVVALLAPSSASNPGAAQLGKALVNAARLSAVDANDPLLQLRVYDTAGDAATAQRMAAQAIRDGAKLIVGPLFGANTRAIRSTAAAANVNVISFSTDSSVAGGPIYLSGFLPEKASQRILGYAQSRGYGTLGIFYPNTPYGQVANKGAQTAGASLVTATAYDRSQEGIPPAAQDFAANVKATGAKALLIAESGQALNFVVGQLANQGLTSREYKYLGLGEWNSRSVFESRILRGAWFPAPDPNALNVFVNRYKDTYKDVPPPLAMLGYDAVQIASQLLVDARRNRSGAPFSAQALTRPQGFRGVVGPVRFGPDGLADRGLAILQIDKGKFTVIDNAPPVLGAGS